MKQKKLLLILILFILAILIGVGIYVYAKEGKLLSQYSQLSKERMRGSVDLQPEEQKDAHYVGSKKCGECHEKNYKLNQNSMHSKMIQDVRKDPSAIVGDFSKLPDDADFKREDIVYTIGSKFKQRYMLRKDFNGKEDYIIGNYQWNSELKKWQGYKVYKYWYASAYEHDNKVVPTSLVCDGCHFVGYMSKEKRIEPAIRCESCHGAGSKHVKDPKSGIYRASNADPQRSTEVCLQCHMRNRDKRMDKMPLADLFGKAKDYPAGFEPGKPLADYKKPAPFSLGVDTKEFWGNGAAKKNRTQGNEYVRSGMYKHGVTCINCHNPHSTSNTAKKPLGNASCMNCHQFGSLNGPHQANIEAHTRHKAGSKGSSCIGCHMPKVGKHTGKSPLTVRSHLFGFIYPDETRKYGVPNGCNSCHKDKSIEWSEKYLKAWGMNAWEMK